MTSYKSELEIGLPYEICIVVRAYMKEKGMSKTSNRLERGKEWD